MSACFRVRPCIMTAARPFVWHPAGIAQDAPLSPALCKLMLTLGQSTSESWSSYEDQRSCPEGGMRREDILWILHIQPSPLASLQVCIILPLS